MNQFFSDLKVIELAGVLAGPSVGLFFAELGAKVIKIENPKIGGDVTRNWKLKTENPSSETSAYFWCVNANKEFLLIDLSVENELQMFYDLIKTADILITNFKLGDDIKFKVDYHTLKILNPSLIYASINGFGKTSPRTAYDLILQAESGFMSINGELNANPLKMPVALIDILAGHQLKEAVLIALLRKYKSGEGSYVTVSLFDTAISSLANQATNWLIAHHLPSAQGSLHPNIAPYGELFQTKDNHYITFAIGSDKQFKSLCQILDIDLKMHVAYETNQERVKHRESLFDVLHQRIKQIDFQLLFESCLQRDVPIGKIRNIQEVFELPDAQKLIHRFVYQGQTINSISSISFQFNA